MPRERRPSAGRTPRTLALAESNPLCRKCLRSCRQPLAAILIECPRFQPRPFRISAPPGDQLDLFGEPDKRP